MLRVLSLLSILVLVGCGKPAANAPVAEDAHVHEHTAGPHGGAIIELGDHHGELVHDDAAGTVTVYILDGAATENVPIAATEATINITREGLGKQFTLAASPMEGEADGMSSRFESSDAQLAEELDNEAAVAVFVVSINDQQVRAMVEHAHDHDHDHDHAHEEGDGHDDDHAHEEGDHDH